ncbi:MAG: hypothetical protein ACREF0_21995, partial [Acetobacteraceae bacterium]
GSSAPNSGWHHFSGPPPSQQNPPSKQSNAAPQEDSQNPQAAPAQQQAPPDNGQYQDQQDQGPSEQDQGIPANLTVRPGTFITVRIDQKLSSDKNQPGDAFSATLEKPIVAEGVVVAQRGETVAGRVTYVQKAGKLKGTSRLALELTDLTLVDGREITIQSQMMRRSGGTSRGIDAGTVAGTTALGAAIGAAADWGTGAAIGAGAGAAAGALGVLLTRGRAAVVYPEDLLTFRIDAPVTISTVQSRQAFRYVEPEDYQAPASQQNAPPQSRACSGNGCAPPAYLYAPPYALYYGYYGPGYYPFYYGPSFFIGRGFYWRGRR